MKNTRCGILSSDAFLEIPGKETARRDTRRIPNMTGSLGSARSSIRGIVTKKRAGMVESWMDGAGMKQAAFPT